LFDGLRKHGWIDGRNTLADRRRWRRRAGLRASRWTGR
jgi:hypothetical protein